MLDAGLPMPSGRIIQRDSKVENLEYPCVVKPTTTENTIGMTLVRSPHQLKDALNEAFKYSSDVIIDKFIAGREVRCCAVEEIDSTGKVEVLAFTPQEYEVRKNDIRTLEDKILLDSNGLPLGMRLT